MNANGANPTADRPGRPRITKVVADLEMGLFEFTYDDTIIEIMKIVDPNEVPTVAALLTALGDEVAKYGRPQGRLRQPAPGSTVAE